MADDDTTAVGAPLTFAAWWVHPPVVGAFAVADTSLMGRSFARHGIVNSPSLWAPAATHYSGPIVRRLLAVGARVNVTGLNGSALWGRTWPAASPTRYRADGRGRLYGHDGRPKTSGGVEAARQAVSAGDGDMVCLLEGACGERADTRPTCCQWVFFYGRGEAACLAKVLRVVVGLGPSSLAPSGAAARRARVLPHAPSRPLCAPRAGRVCGNTVADTMPSGPMVGCSGLGQLPASCRTPRYPGPRTERCVRRSEERRVGKECRSRWSPYH